MRLHISHTTLLFKFQQVSLNKFVFTHGHSVSNVTDSGEKKFQGHCAPCSVDMTNIVMRLVYKKCPLLVRILVHIESGSLLVCITFNEKKTFVLLLIYSLFIYLQFPVKVCR